MEMRSVYGMSAPPVGEKLKQALQEFEELLEEFESDINHSVTCYEQGCHTERMDLDIERGKIKIMGMFRTAMNALPEKPCQNCGGTGSIETTDWVPYGDTNVRMVQNFQCDNLSDGHCCQCGGDIHPKLKICESCGKDWKS